MTREEAINYAENKAVQIKERIFSDQIGNIPYGNYAIYSTELEFLSIALAALREQEGRRWIPVSERFPEKNVKVLGYAKYLCAETYRILPVRWNGYVWCDTTGIRMQVTHWMPLPEPPKETQE